MLYSNIFIFLRFIYELDKCDKRELEKYLLETRRKKRRILYISSGDRVDKRNRSERPRTNNLAAILMIIQIMSMIKKVNKDLAQIVNKVWQDSNASEKFKNRIKNYKKMLKLYKLVA